MARKETERARRLMYLLPNSRILLLASGLAFFYVWLIGHMRVFSFSLETTLRIVGVNYNTFSMIVNALLLFSLFILYLKYRTVFFGKAYFACAGLCLLMGYLIGLLVEINLVTQSASSILIMLHCIFTNIGMTLLSLEWIRMLGRLGSRTTIAVIVFASLFACLILFSLSFTSFLLIPVLPLIFPLGSLMVLVNHYMKNGLLQSKRIHDYGMTSKLNIPYRLLFTVFLSDFVFSAVVVLANSANVNPGFGVDAVCYAGAALLLMFAALYFKFDFNSLIYRIAFIIMAIGCIFFALPDATFFMLGIYINQLGYRFMLALVWVMSAWLIDQRRLSANWVFPVVTGVAFVGQFLGSTYAITVVSFLGTTEGILISCLIMASALPISALLLMDTHNLQKGWGFSRPADIQLPKSDRIDLACAALSKEFGLTARESEVFTLMAKGNSRQAISEKLVISLETVKSYANKMYSKVGVHSRQSLIEIVDRKMDEFETQDEIFQKTIL